MISDFPSCSILVYRADDGLVLYISALTNVLGRTVPQGVRVDRGVFLENLALIIIFRPEIRRDYPLNLSISLSGGKETNKDSPSNGE